MSQKLQELTQKLYQEGVEKARTEANTILEDAEAKKQELLQAAQQKAETLVANGKKEAEQLVAKGESELKLAAKQALSALKQEAVNLLSGNVLSEGVAGALADKEVVKRLIVEIAAQWGSGEQTDLRVTLSKSQQSELEGFLKKELKAELDKGLIVEFEERVKSGFRIQAQDGSYMLSFAEQDFEQYFQSFIKERTKALLFSET